MDKLAEERVHRVIEPMLSGTSDSGLLPTDDILYVRALGLIETAGQLRLANRIYQEIIPRELTYSTQVTITHRPAWYVQPGGRLDMPRLLTAFQDFFRQHAEHWIERFAYKEAAPQLLLQAFLQRIINGGGRIEREYGLRRLRTDLLVVWPYSGGTQRCIIELKILYGSRERTIQEGLAQTWEYMDICATDADHLVLFDRSPYKAWEDKIFCRQEVYRGKEITVWGM